MTFNDALEQKHNCEIASEGVAQIFEDMAKGLALLSMYGIIQPKDEQKYMRSLETLALSDYAEPIEE